MAKLYYVGLLYITDTHTAFKSLSLMCMFCMTDGVYDESGYVHTFIQNHTVYYIDCVYRTALAFLVNTIDHLSTEHVGLPDENGRVEILQIHTAQMIKYKKLAEDVNIKELAKRTRNFSGAELEGQLEVLNPQP